MIIDLLDAEPKQENGKRDAVSLGFARDKRRGGLRLMKKVFGLVVVLVMLVSGSAFAHSGGTDSQGCHHNWANGTGQYHCHNPKLLLS